MGSKKQDGFHVIEIFIIVAALGLLGFIIWRTLGNTASSGQTSSQSFIEWSFDGTAWKAGGSAPACEDPLAISPPIDLAQATAKLLPGQVRGGDFKPHGGLAIDNTPDNSVTVSAVRDAYLYRGSRYIQDGSLQYMFDFMDSCGVMYRLDHLATLTDQFSQYAAKLPEPKADDSRTHTFTEHPLIKKGTAIATEVGLKEQHNVFFDLGVYDLRKQNEASYTDVYKTDQLRINDKEQSFFAVCWFTLLPSADKSLVAALPSRSSTSEGGSDYCAAD